MKYFAYGSNMSQVRMKEERKINFLNRRHAVLNNYSFQFNKIATGKLAKSGEGKGNIVCSAGGVVEGALYDIKPIDRNKLDCVEGYPFHYERITVMVQLDNESVVEAFAYIAHHDKVKNGLKPTKKYLSYYLEADDILSKEYYRKLKSWPTLD
ncbi:gamma-glutamylcyclotransferase family protein [Candidatus Nitrosotenuis chungbukensis]|uniref:gamma-glutamylcyclotransferase family protein n=1 Tax=Candidatus Nitrosotenuis chungbukensis TaxID=1353246 RepID=UPI000694FC2A|nr:gamma-glutamylcyclotransferase family protein [Candidatus Nitrosotenuis chungbukensis]WKT57924.1 gamma-glutamylcyclotransferase family protein [Candidatus Nitrosotenuis chungbukensis]